MSTLCLHPAVCWSTIYAIYVTVDRIAHTGHIFYTECISDHILASSDGFMSPCPTCRTNFHICGSTFGLSDINQALHCRPAVPEVDIPCNRMQIYLTVHNFGICPVNTINSYFLAYAASFLMALQIRRLRN